MTIKITLTPDDIALINVQTMAEYAADWEYKSVDYGYVRLEITPITGQ